MEQLTRSVVAVDQTGQIVTRSQHTVSVEAVDLGRGISLTLALVPGGSFLMGSQPGLGYDDERPQHQVALEPFLLGACAITQAQWEAVTGEQPLCRFAGPQTPVDNVSWTAAVNFCAQLSQLADRRFRLPSEAQWEYACRAGTPTPFHFGPSITTDLANYNGFFTYRAAPQGLYRHVTTDVRSFPPNAFGLFDMHGNLWEWCADAWHDDYVGAPADGSAWGAECHAAERIARGGSWHEPPDVCRSALRIKFRASEGDDFIGFRVCAPAS
jgi:formylglycine-generating enzyme required for sulfatase activity